MAVELQALQERDRMLGDDMMIRDQRLAAADIELQAHRTDKALSLDEAARERARANDLDVQLSAANFRVQDLAQ